MAKKTARRAVDRNRIKRLMKESFRLQIDRLKEGFSLVFLATRKAQPNVSQAAFAATIEALLREADLFARTD